MSDTITPDHTAPATTLAPPDPAGAALEAAPAVLAVPTTKAPTMVPLDPDAVPALDQRVDTYVAQVLGTDVHSPEFSYRADDVRSLGDDAIRSAADTSTRLLRSPVRAMQKGPLTESGKVAATLVELRRTVEGLDPGRGGKLRRIAAKVPKGDRLVAYFHRYESAQANLDAIVTALCDGQDELRRDNAALEQEKVQLWETMQRLVQYVYVAEEMDRRLCEELETLDVTDPERARRVREDVLFYVRQKHQDLLTQLAVSVQGYMAIDLVRRNNTELVKGVDRATTTTVAALRTAMVVSQALANQKLVLDQVDAVGATTAQLMESTSQMLADQSTAVAEQAASATIGIETLQAAFENIYRSMDAIDAFKVQALDSMAKTVHALEVEVARSQRQLERVAPAGAVTSATATAALDAGGV